MNMLKKYTKLGVIVTGDDDLELDTPTFEIINITVDTVNQQLKIEILHEVIQGTLTQQYSRTFNVPFLDLETNDKVTGQLFLDAIEEKILELPQYVGSTEV